MFRRANDVSAVPEKTPIAAKRTRHFDAVSVAGGAVGEQASTMESMAAIATVVQPPISNSELERREKKKEKLCLYYGTNFSR